jgi:DNA replication protein DnaC
MSRRLRATHLPGAATPEGFDFSYNPKLPTAHIRDLARLEFIAAREGLCIYGPVGWAKDRPGRGPSPPGVPAGL